MGIGAGILIAAVGAVLAFAVTAEIGGVDIQTIGVIMIVAGLAIALFAAIATASTRRRVAVGGYATDRVVTHRAVPTTTVVDDGPVDGARI